MMGKYLSTSLRPAQRLEFVGLNTFTLGGILESVMRRKETIKFFDHNATYPVAYPVAPRNLGSRTILYRPNFPRYYHVMII
jgi:hypothetical protein